MHHETLSDVVRPSFEANSERFKNRGRVRAAYNMKPKVARYSDRTPRASEMQSDFAGLTTKGASKMLRATGHARMVMCY